MPEDEESVKDITREMAVEAVKECMKVLFYRDARSTDRYSIAVVTKEGIEMKEDEKLEGQSWAFADMIRGMARRSIEIYSIDLVWRRQVGTPSKHDELSE